MMRSATPEDAAQVTELLAELGYPDNEVGDVRRRLAIWSSDPYSTVLVAADGDTVAGVVAVTAVLSLERPGRWARIVALVTGARFRGQGIGRDLMVAAEEFARECGCRVVEVSSANRRTDAHAFYQQLGYENWADRSGRFIKDLIPGHSDGSYAARFP